ncbi:MAG: phytanoyl-CoA dioxygenase family protein [Robiginitomaculum sp.]|nr:phytanoyl-CoA dioxygenase family protein [Robiginitomaculum sp.]
MTKAPMIDGEVNPTTHLGARANASPYFCITIDAEWEDLHRQRRSKSTRRSERRRERQLNEIGPMKFETHYDGPALAQATEVMFKQRSARFGEQGIHDFLSDAGMADFYRSQLFANITHDLIGEHCRLYWDQAVYKHPQKGGEFPYHQDNGYTFVHPQAYLTCWLALSDAPIKAGCPWVLPDAHLSGTYQHSNKPAGLEIENVQDLINLHGEIAAPVTAGDMVIFSSLTPHKTGANLSKHIRKALIIQFIPDGAVCITTDGEEKLNDRVLHQTVI